MRKRLKVAFVSTYPPRECGIATFTGNLVSALVRQPWPRVEVMVTAVRSPVDNHPYAPPVEFVIRQEHQADYVEAARRINYSGADLCVVEHEYGIYGGGHGVYILSFLHHLEVPCFVTLHTVLDTPSYGERTVVRRLAEKARRLTVMSRRAEEFLATVYGVPRDKVVFIPHGVPDINVRHGPRWKRELNLEGRTVLLTFGLLSRNKGIETVLQALSPVVERHPDLLYIVLGQTHPMVRRVSGEEYRHFLIRTVEEFGLKDHVLFLDQFVTERQLVRYLAATDIYLTPYLNRRQITSGTLSYAIGAGAAVISTPYWYAEEMLADGRGVLFGFNDHKALSSILLELLDRPERLARLRRRAYRYGRRMVWSRVGWMYADLFLRELRGGASKVRTVTVTRPGGISPAEMPALDLEHVRRLTDDTGIVQHARHHIPYLKDGYCTDDNARGLVMALMAWRQERSAEALRLLEVYLRFLMYMQREDGKFHNFLSFDRRFLDEEGTEDAFGRAFWALGELVKTPPSESLLELGRTMFERSLPAAATLRSPRAMAYASLGLVRYLSRHSDHEPCLALLARHTERLLELYRTASDASWRWFEPVVAYDNAVLPMALMEAWSVLRKEELRAAAFDTLAFLESFKFRNGYLDVVGSQGWYPKGGAPAQAAQQPVNAMSLVLCYRTAYALTGETRFLDRMHLCYRWFLGENFLRMPLYDFETKGCNDGLETDHVNRNQGAESTLAFLIAHLAVLSGHEQATGAP